MPVLVVVYGSELRAIIPAPTKSDRAVQKDETFGIAAFDTKIGI